MFVGALGVVVFDHALAPLSRPGFCVSCHEMAAAHAGWQKASHFVNRTGVKVTCVECHLPHKDNRLAHLAARFWAGGKDLRAHLAGHYSAEVSRERVLRSLPNGRCTKCHDNLTSGTSAPAVRIVHAAALAGGANRAQACVACHDNMHSPPRARPAPKAYTPGDNSYCMTCHINFAYEEFTVVHVKAGIGCVKCHGATEDHAADEEHLTPPDIIYAKAAVNASCLNAECHPRKAMEAETGHRAIYAGADPLHPYCTDCHGRHMLPKRTRRWDKETRKLIEVNGLPPVQAAAGPAADAQAGPM